MFREYRASIELELKAIEIPANAFYSLIMAAARQAGSEEIEKLERAFPDAINELRKRYNAPGGRLIGDPIDD